MTPPSDKPEPSKLPRGAAVLMIAFILAIGLLAIYANVQRAHRDRIETVATLPASAATPTPTPR